MNIGEKFKDIRESKGMTKYRLTQITGISGHHIKGIENNTRQPTIDTLQRLLEAMGYSLAEFFSDGESGTYLSDEERRLIENFRVIDKPKAEALLNMSDVLTK